MSIIREASIAAAKDDEPLKTCQKRLAKVEKELNKNLIAWRDAPEPSMKEAFFEMYQQNKKQKDELEKEIENLSKQRKNAEDLEKEILGVREHIEKIKKVDVIDRSVAENFIDRIIVCADGNVIVILKFGTVYNNIITQEYIIPLSFDGICSNLRFINCRQDDDVDWQNMFFSLSVRCSDRASSPSILPTVLPIFTYDYKEKNGHREARGKSLFINAEYIQASVITCLRKDDRF